MTSPELLPHADLVEKLRHLANGGTGPVNEICAKAADAIQAYRMTVGDLLDQKLTALTRAPSTVGVEALSAAISEKLQHPVFRGLKWEVYDGYLPIKVVRPTAVTHWIVRLPSGKEILLDDPDKQSCITLEDALSPTLASEKEGGKAVEGSTVAYPRGSEFQVAKRAVSKNGSAGLYLKGHDAAFWVGEEDVRLIAPPAAAEIELLRNQLLKRKRHLGTF